MMTARVITTIDGFAPFTIGQVMMVSARFSVELLER